MLAPKVGGNSEVRSPNKKTGFSDPAVIGRGKLSFLTAKTRNDGAITGVSTHFRS